MESCLFPVSRIKNVSKALDIMNVLDVVDEIYVTEFSPYFIDFF